MDRQNANAQERWQPVSHGLGGGEDWAVGRGQNRAPVHLGQESRAQVPWEACAQATRPHTGQTTGLCELQPALYTADSFPDITILKMLFDLYQQPLSHPALLWLLQGEETPLRIKTGDSGSASCSANTCCPDRT